MAQHPRRRLGRRLMVATLAAAAGGCLALLLYLRSGHLDAWARERLIAGLATALGRPVTVESVALRWLPPGAVVTGVSTDPPRMAAARVRVSVSFLDLLRGRLRVTDVEVERPELDWDVTEQRLVPPRRGSEGGPPPAAGLSSRLALERVLFRDGMVRIGSTRHAFSARLAGVSALTSNDSVGRGGDPGAEPSAGWRGPWSGTLNVREAEVAFGTMSASGLSGTLGFEATQGGIQVTRATLSARGLRVTGSGRLLAGPPARSRWDLRMLLDPPAAPLQRPLPQLAADALDVQAQLAMGPEGPTLSGSFEATGPSLDLDRARDADGPKPAWKGRLARGTFEAVSGRIEVTAQVDLPGGATIRGTYEGARAAQDASGAPPPAAAAGRPAAPRRNVVDARLEGIPLAEVLSPFDLPGDDRVLPDAAVSGTASLRWEEGDLAGASGRADLTLSPGPGSPSASGRAALAWRGRRVTVESADLLLAGAALNVAGVVQAPDGGGPASLDLRGDLRTEDSDALGRFVERRFGLESAAPGARRPIRPTDLRGGLRASVRLEGTSARPRVSADFEADDLDVRLPAPGGGEGRDATGGGVDLHLTRARGALRYAAGRLDIDLAEAAGEGLRVSGALALDTARSRVLSLRMEADSVPARLAATLAGADADRLGLEGTARASVDLAAAGETVQGLRGRVSLEAAEARVGPLPLRDLRAGATLEPGRLTITSATCGLWKGTVRLEGGADLSAGRASGTIEVRAEGIDLAAADAEMAGPSLSGSLDLTGRVRLGEPPGLEGAVTVTGGTIDGIDLGRLEGTVGGTTREVKLAAKDESGALEATAVLRPGAEAEAGPWTVDAVVEARGLSLEEARPLLPAGALAGLAGQADGRVVVRGPLTRPADWEMRAVLDRLSLTAGDYALQSDGPVRVTVLDRFLTLAPARLTGEKTDLTLGGSMVLGGRSELTALLEGRYDLGLVEVVLPHVRASGPGSASLRVIQRGDSLTYSGTITLQDGRIVHPALPLPLEHVRGRASFTEEGLLQVEELSAELGGGRAQGTGWARFEGASLPDLHLAIKGEGIRAEILPDLNAFFDSDVSLDKQGDVYWFGGGIRIQRAVFSRPIGIEASDFFLRGREFAPSARSGPSGAPAPTVLLDFDIVADGDVWIRNEDALIEASAVLALEGTLDRPELSGRISALEGGTYRFRDVTYRIVGGALDFADVIRIDPLIDIEASTRVQTYEITLRITGRFSKPIYELTSEPPLPQRDIVWLLITGRTPAESSAEGASTLAESQVASYLAAPVAGVVSNPLERILGVSSLQIDPFFLNGAADPAARVTVTRRVASNLLFTYSTSLGDSGQEVYQVQYNPGRMWDLLGTRDFDGSLGADVRFRRRWGGAAPAPARPGAEDAASRLRVGRIALVADHLVDPATALVRRLPFDEGDVFRRGDLLEGREAIRQHYVTHGRPAARVEVLEEEPVPPRPGYRDVRYVVTAGPAHDVLITGPVRRRPIRKAVRQAWLEPLLLDDLAEVARAAALGFLKQKGFYTARVDARMEALDADQRRLRLELEPGSRVTVDTVRIEGNEAIPQERIRRQMLTGTGGLFGRGLLKEPVLKDDVAAVLNLYRTSGFLEARVAAPDVALKEDGRKADVTVRVQEGPRSLFGSVAIEGEAEGAPAEDLLKAAGLAIGEPVDPAALEASADRIREALDAEGYSRARVAHRLEGPPGSTRALFSITPGERVRVQDVILEGYERTHERVIRREVTLDRGDWLTRARMLETQRNLYRLGVFRSVQLAAEPVEGRPGWVRVHVKLQEGPPVLTAWGAGYDSLDRARASFEVADNNLFGTRRSAALFLRGSAVDRRVQLTLRDPNLFGERIETLITGFWERQEFESFDLRRTGAVMQLTRKLTPHTTLFGRYRLEDIDLFDLEISEEETGQQTIRLGSVAASAARDTRDDIVNPSRGGLASLDVRLYHHGVGSESDFVKVFASASAFKEIGRGVVWASSIRAGVLTSRDIPVSERFFAGGDTTVRGFEYNTVGPLDPNTENPVGGEGLFLINQELRVPIHGPLKGVVFYDAGNVYRDFSDYDVTDLRHVGGLGIRLDTPVGPFRVEYGRKLDRERGESPGEIFFSIGHAF